VQGCLRVLAVAMAQPPSLHPARGGYNVSRTNRRRGCNGNPGIGMKPGRLGLIMNLLAQASRPARARVMLKKLWRRIADDKGLISRQENLDWLRRHCVPFDRLANAIDPGLWSEAQEVSAGIAANARQILQGIDYDLGGGGACPIIYFVTRRMRPATAVETGVAAGFSSCAFLAALDRNGDGGTLHSSDFPRFRLPRPERFIGILVAEPLRRNWHLHIEGDEANLPRILGRVGRIDIFHYDSDKSYSGRRFVMNLIRDRMSDRGIILMDDIQDNSYFHDHVTASGVASWSVFEFEGKYVGMIGELTGRRG
jgi:predicted O-methyltransferase YrrM